MNKGSYYGKLYNVVPVWCFVVTKSQLAEFAHLHRWGSTVRAVCIVATDIPALCTPLPRSLSLYKKQSCSSHYRNNRNHRLKSSNRKTYMIG
jgi:hypothetical protein